MKKISIILLILCYYVINFPYFGYATEPETTAETNTSSLDTTGVSENNSAIESGSFSLDALHPMIGSDNVSENMRSAIVYEANSQTLMYTWNPDAQMYPASFVKILTALIAIEKGSLDALVTVSQSALDGLPVDAMSSELVVDEVMSLSDLIHCLLIGSANDAANVIAEHIGGSQEAFVQIMNDYAKALGCNATHFTNASGLHDDNQHTTARDVARILDAAIKNDSFKTIFSKYDYMVPATNKSPERKLITSSSIQNTNSRLYYDERVIGSRTGVTNDGRRCLAVAAEYNGMSIISVVMGSESVYQEDGYSAITVGGYQETTLLLDTCLTGYKAAEVLTDGQALRQIFIENGDNHLVMGPDVSVSTVLPQDMTIAGLTFQYVDKPIQLPIEKGEYVSDVFIWNGSMCVGQAKLLALNRVLPSTVASDKGVSEDSDHFSTGLWTILTLLVVLLAFLLIRFSGNIKLYFRRLRRKRHRRNRKRAN